MKIVLHLTDRKVEYIARMDPDDAIELNQGFVLVKHRYGLAAFPYDVVLSIGVETEDPIE